MSAVIILADRINAEHAASQSAAESAVEHARRCGELLIEAKSKTSHGDWLTWLTENCPAIADRTARAYMRLHREMLKLDPAKRQRVADLSIRDAMRAVAANTGALRSVPEERLLAVESRWNEKGGSVYGVARSEVQLAKHGAWREFVAPPFADPVKWPTEETPEFYAKNGCIPRGYGHRRWSELKKAARGQPEFAALRQSLKAAKKIEANLKRQLRAAQDEVHRVERDIDKATHAYCVRQHFEATA